jgi:ELWxxDGT repeat protein
MRLTLSLPLAIVLLGAVPAGAITPHLVKDINTVPRSAGSAPADYVTVGGLAFFSAADSLTGRELWRTNGTEAGTFQVVDACPGDCSGSPRFVAQNGRSYFFLASSGDAGEELWVTGGLPANTFRLTDGLRFPGLTEGIWNAWVAGQSVLYFAADDGIHGRELWRTDGTRAGTFMVADLRLGPDSSNLGDLTDFNGRLYFRADDGLQGSGLWTSDGTAAGTRLVRDPDPSTAGNTGPVYLRVVGRTLFFVAPVKSRGFELWKSDGTTAGTVALTNARFSPARPFLDFTVFGNRLVFVASDAAKGQELWVSDGTAGGTRPVTSLPKADAFFHLDGFSDLPLPRTALGNRFLFRADDGKHGAELWSTDGTPKGTRMIKDLCPGTCWGAISDVYVAGSLAFFTKWDGTSGGSGVQPWVTDGTAAGTHLIRDVCGGSCRLGPFGWKVAGGKAFFLTAPEPPGLTQLWRTDGTSKGTVLLTSTSEPSASVYGVFPAASLGSALLYTASESIAGQEPWLTDGTPQGTRLVRDINLTNAGGSWPSSLSAAGGEVYFLADDGLHGRDALWVSDGTEAGTQFVFDFFPDGGPFNSSYIVASAAAGGRFFFVLAVSAGEDVQYSLWSTDGTEGGTVQLLPEGESQLSLYVSLTALGNDVYFAASDGIHGNELWVSDGTAGGTRMVVDLAAGDSASGPQGLTVFQGNLYFSAFVANQQGLWRSDGTAGGTVLVKQGNFRLLTEHAGRLYFSGWDPEHGYRLWSTDGTAAGTTIADLTPGSGSLQPYQMVSNGSRLFMWGITVEPNGTPHNDDAGMWVSDGTAAGTRRISDVQASKPTLFKGEIYFVTPGGVVWKSDGTTAGTGPLLTREGQRINYPFDFRVLDDRLFVTTIDSRLYESDGTPAGTFQLLRLKGGSNIFEIEPAGSHLLFRNWDRDHGTELWAVEAE